jgi:hypothetical protein
VNYYRGKFNIIPRGILLMYEMGAGKTYPSMMMMIDDIISNRSNKIIILLPASIKNNFEQ